MFCNWTHYSQWSRTSFSPFEPSFSATQTSLPNFLPVFQFIAISAADFMIFMKLFSADKSDHYHLVFERWWHYQSSQPPPLSRFRLGTLSLFIPVPEYTFRCRPPLVRIKSAQLDSPLLCLVSQPHVHLHCTLVLSLIAISSILSRSFFQQSQFSPILCFPLPYNCFWKHPIFAIHWEWFITWLKVPSKCIHFNFYPLIGLLLLDNQFQRWCQRCKCWLPFTIHPLYFQSFAE